MARVDKSIAERLAERSVLDPETGCVLWTGAMISSGYGVMRVDGKARYTHRLALESECGPIPRGYLACHRCDNPACIRPDHLFCGSATDNLRDAAAKGRIYNQKKTHCPAGHPYDGDNLGVTKRPNGGTNRYCMECHRQSALALSRTPKRQAYAREYRKENRERIAARTKQHRENNKERIAAQRKQYRDKKRSEKLATTKETTWQPSTSTNPAQPSSPSTSSPTGEIPTCV